MSPEIHRIEPEPAFHSGAVRKAGPKRQREGEPQRKFEDEIEGREDDVIVPPPPSSHNPERFVSPPTEEDGGTHVNVIG